jgi:hypothetical protein
VHYEEFDPTDYSVVVKLRGKPPRAWKWEIYRACRWGPLESSPVFFEGMAVAAKEGKKALARLLAKAKHALAEIGTACNEQPLHLLNCTFNCSARLADLNLI